MSLPDEENARKDLERQLREVFDAAERLHNTAVAVVASGTFTIQKQDGFNRGVFVIILSLLTKACKTFRAIQVVSGYGLGQDAAVLARQLFETAVAVEFILQKDLLLRAGMFAAHQDQRQLVLLEKAEKVDALKHLATEESLSKVRVKVRAWDQVIGHEAVESVRRHWSGHSLEWAADQVEMGKAYGTMYRYTSAFAHGSDVTNHFMVKASGDAPTLKLSPGDDQIVPVLSSSMMLLRDIVETIDKAFGLGQEQAVDEMLQQVIVVSLLKRRAPDVATP